jgi:Fe-S oxidoreductase
MIPMIRVQGDLNTLDMSLGTNSTCCGIAGGSWLIEDDDGPEELHGRVQRKLPAAKKQLKSERGAKANVSSLYKGGR